MAESGCDFIVSKWRKSSLGILSQAYRVWHNGFLFRCHFFNFIFWRTIWRRMIPNWPFTIIVDYFYKGIGKWCFINVFYFNILLFYVYFAFLRLILLLVIEIFVAWLINLSIFISIWKWVNKLVVKFYFVLLSLSLRLRLNTIGLWLSAMHVERWSFFYLLVWL